MSKVQPYHPKYWLLWALLSVFWCFAKLPRCWQVHMGAAFGRGMVTLVPKLRHVIRSNLIVCFPDLTPTERFEAEKQASSELGISIFETFWLWFNKTDSTVKGHYDLSGYGHIDRAMADGKGIIFLACHHGAVDVNGALLAQLEHKGRTRIGTFRKTDAVVNALLHKFRSPFSDRMMSATDQRGMVRVLRKGGWVWYAPDIEVKNKASAFIDFMGVRASTTLAVSRLAKATNSVVIPFAHYRISNGLDYQVVVHPALDNFPSDNLEQDARAMNAAIEKIIKPYPYRYWWAIKRFKHRPEGEESIY